jgi:hypothetical protein
MDADPPSMTREAEIAFRAALSYRGPMRERLPLLLSLVLNLALAVMIVRLSRDTEDLSSDPAWLFSKTNLDASGKVHTQIVLRRLHFTWAEVESDDYPTYIANLRRIGCPEKTIRDIIVADVGELYADRMTKEVVLPEQQWWKADPQLDGIQAAADQIHALEAEKNALLTQLLGPGWNSSRAGPAGAPVMDGPVLGQLSPDAKAQVYQIEATMRRDINAYLTQMAQEKKASDPAEVARIRQTARDSLARVLTPQQLEEYQLRYSVEAETMRQQLRGFGADAAEFRKIFEARDSFDQQLAQLSGTDPGTQQRRQDLERMREESLKQALGPERYPLYQLTQNPLFRDAQAKAEQNGGSAENVLPIFEINQAAQAEIQRIETDPALSDQDRLAALQMVQNQQQSSIRKLLGKEPPPTPPLPPGASP